MRTLSRTPGVGHIHTWKLFLALCGMVLVSMPVMAQKNIAPQATVTGNGSMAAGCQTGACSVLNDLNFGTCGTQQMWISTATPPSTTIGADWIQWDFPSTKRFNKLIIHHASSADPRFLAGALIQYWNGSAWVNHHTFSNLPLSCSNTISFNAISAKRFRITQFVMKGPGQLSNPNFREFEIIEAPGGQNNAGVQAITAPVNFCPGTYDVKVDVENGGLNKLDSVRINWSVNGVMQPTIYYKTAIDTAGSIGGNSKNVTLGTQSFAAGVVKTIKVWTSRPNGGNDTMPNNDTIVVNMQPALSGTFTVGGASPDFATPVAAADALSNYGVCGPVILNIRAGTYNGQVKFLNVSGTSTTNTITVIGAGQGLTNLTWTGTSTANMQTVTIDNTSYLTLKDMTIENKGVTYGVAVQLMNGADYNTIENCEIKLPVTATATTSGGIVASNSLTTLTTGGNTTNYTIIRNNSITGGGYYPLILRGSSTGVGGYIMGNEVLNNTIDNYYYYGMYFYYGGETKVIGNKINNGRYSNGYGIYYYYQSNYELMQNEINAPYYGLYTYYGNYYNYDANGTKPVIANNIINTSNYYGFYNTNLYYTDVLYNSVEGNSTYGTYISNANGNNVIGNIFTNGASGYAFYATGGTYSNIDYNIYYAPGTTNPLYYNKAYASLTAWKVDVPQFNKHSLEQDPRFMSSSDLHLQKNIGLMPYGPDLGLKHDVDGDPRCMKVPTIGADEVATGKGNSKVSAGIFGPDTVYAGSPVVFEGKYQHGTVQSNYWYLDGVYVQDTLNLVVTMGATGGPHTLMVIAESCDHRDTATRTFYVQNISKAPVADFMMSNLVPQGDAVRFNDLSLNGPTSWQWEITPDITYVNSVAVPRYEYMSGDDKSFNPSVRFDYPGRYKVCLTVSNSFGSDKICRTDYITVMPRVDMGSVQVIKETQGYLYDDGGMTGSYQSGQTRGMLIAPCASEVMLIFNDFSLECQDDYIRIYDGADKTGKVLHSCTWNTGNGGGPGLTGPGCSQECVPTLSDTFIARSGQMYVEMYSSSNGITSSGFEAYWWTTPKNTQPPVADFLAPDSICYGTLTTFYNNTNEQNVKIYWELDGDANAYESEDTVSAVWAYFIPGNIQVKMVAEGCGGFDTVIKTIKVYNPNKPGVTFTSDNVRPTTTDVVTLTPAIKGCVEKYNWRIAKSSGGGTFIYTGGTDANSLEAKVTFLDTGCWDVELWAQNVIGADSLMKKCYITVKDPYCRPTVGTLSSDIGMGHVRFHEIDRPSGIGFTDHSSYLQTDRTNVEIGVTYELEVRRNSNINNISWTAWIDWNQDGDHEDLFEEVGSIKNTNGKVWQTQVTIPIIAKEGPTVLRVGASRGNGSNTPCGQNSFGEFEDYRVVVTLDRTAPEITLIGSSDTIVEQGSNYVDPGVTAVDNLDGNITHEVTADTLIVSTGKTGELNTYIVRDYQVRYSVKDAAGNEGKAVRTVRIGADVTAPVLQVALPETLSLSVDDATTTYHRPVVLKAQDNIDGDFTSSVMVVTGIDPGLALQVQVVDAVDVTKVGTYTVTYYAVDHSGNAVTVTRTVVIYDGQAPVMLLIGDQSIKHQIGTPYDDAGVTITDNYYPEAELQAIKQVSVNVNADKFGKYQVVYTLTDPSGNGPVSAIRDVEVTDLIAPQIALIGPAKLVADVHEEFVDPGVKVSDNYGLKGSWTAGGSFYASFPDGMPVQTGQYIITYEVEDLAGNIVSIDRDIEVVDRVAPVIMLAGNSALNLCRWAAYNDAGYTLSDNYDDSSEVSVTEEGTYFTEDISLAGTYSLRYRAVDMAGNISYSETRYITVLEASDVRCKANSIEDAASLQDKVSVYPNPNTGVFTVKAELNGERVSMSILNLVGQEVAQVTEGMLSEGIFTVDLSGQASGIYLLKVTSGTYSFTKQIIVAK